MPEAELHDDGRIHVATAWNEKELIKSLPGSRWDAQLKTWTLPCTWAACAQLRGTFQHLFIAGPRLTQWIWDEFNERIKPSLTFREQFEDHSGGIHNVPNLYDFQKIGVEWLVTAGSTLLGDEMGTGKTIQALAAMSIIGADALPALVICPNSVKTNWADEAVKWLPKATPYVVAGSAKERATRLKAAAEDPMALVMVNFEATYRLSRLAGFGSIRLVRCATCDPKYGLKDLKPQSCEVHPRVLNTITFRTIIVDEAHRIKDPKAKQTRATWALGNGDSIRRRWALTGTPLANDPSDLWSIMHFVYPLEYPTKSKFVDRYCLQAWNQHGGLDVVGVNPTTKEEFFKFFDPRFRRMPKALVLDQLPPKIRITRVVEMTPKQKKAYDDIERRLVTRLENGDVLIARSNLSAQVRLLQLASSYATITPQGDDPNDVTQWQVELCEPSPKIDELMAVLAELGDKPCAVSAESRRLIELAAARLTKAGITHGLITGSVDEYERREALRAFQSGELRVLLYTLKAGGTGLTMTATDTIVRLQRSWSMIDNKQGEDRHHRIGSEKHASINIIDIVTQDTVEEQQLLRLNQKMKRLEEITRDRALLLKANRSIAHLDVEEGEITNSFLGEPL